MEITVAYGDGIGREIVDAVLTILKRADVPLRYELVPIGMEAEDAAASSGLGSAAQTSVERTGILLKGPVAQGCNDPAGMVLTTSGHADGHVFAHKRLFRTLPAVPDASMEKQINLTWIEPVGGFSDEASSDALWSDLVRYTCDVAHRKKARRLTCVYDLPGGAEPTAHRLKVLDRVTKDFPSLRIDRVSAETFAQQLTMDPSAFEVVLCGSRHAPVLAGSAAGLVGGTHFVPAARVGKRVSVFETAHGAEFDQVGQDKANPTALLLSATMMLRQLGLVEHASRIEVCLGRALHSIYRRPDLGQDPLPFRTQALVESVCRELRHAETGVSRSSRCLAEHQSLGAGVAA